MIITITGSLGSGKSTIGKILADKLNYKYISGGDIFRKIAEERGVDINKINNEAENNKEVDRLIDEYLEELNEEDKLVIDSRMAWYFIDKSVKIYLFTDVQTAVERISNSNRITEGNLFDREELKLKVQDRRKSEVKRFRKIYGIDIENKENYDLLMSTGNLEPLEIVDKILEYLKDK